jgi:hypothetical protein
VAGRGPTIRLLNAVSFDDGYVGKAGVRGFPTT